MALQRVSTIVQVAVERLMRSEARQAQAEPATAPPERTPVPNTGDGTR
jgi:hypothetical protein